LNYIKFGQIFYKLTQIKFKQKLTLPQPWPESGWPNLGRPWPFNPDATPAACLHADRWAPLVSRTDVAAALSHPRAVRPQPLTHGPHRMPLPQVTDLWTCHRVLFFPFLQPSSYPRLPSHPRPAPAHRPIARHIAIPANEDR